MAYGTSNRINGNKNQENLDRHLKLDDRLDSHQKPVKIGDDITGLLLSDKDVKVEGDLDVYGALNVSGNMGVNLYNDFAPSESAYAGMILGYTRIQNNGTTSGQANISVNTGSMTVLQTVQGTDLSVTFKAPSSGNVEVECSFWTTATSKGVKFSLSDNASYNEVDETHTYDADQTIYIDESDHAMHTVRFAVSGLTAGTSYTYFLAGLASGTFNLSHGRNRTAGTFYPPIILKAIALPNTITTGE